MAELVPEYLLFVPIDPYTGREFEYYSQGVRLELRYYAPNSEPIAAGTPLLWSAGADGQRLDATFVTEPADPAADVSERQIRRDIYQFRGYSWTNHALVFPLPK